MDREQVRRDAEKILASDVMLAASAYRELASSLLAELEQAELQAAMIEQARQSAAEHASASVEREVELLARVVRYEDALREIERRCEKAGLHGLIDVPRAALAKWEQAQGEKP